MKLKVVSLAAGLLVLLLAAVYVHAVDVSVSSDHVYLSSTRGEVFVTADNPYNGSATLSLSATSQYLNQWFDSYSQFIPAGGSGGALLNIQSPDCLRGDDIVRIYAQYCSKDSCQTSVKSIRVTAEPAKACDAYIEGLASQQAYVPALTCSGTSCLYSVPHAKGTIVKSASFDPTTYQVEGRMASGCIQLQRGDTASASVTLQNQGPAGSFDVQVLAPDTQVQGFASRDYVSLQRSESFPLRIDLQAVDGAETGRHFLTLQLLHRADLVLEQDVCADLYDVNKVTLNAPASATIDGSKESVVQVEAQNLGTSADSYSVNLGGVPAGVEVAPHGFTLQPGEKQTIQITFTQGVLKAAHSTMQVLLQGDHSEARASIDLTKYASVPSADISAPLPAGQNGTTYKYTVGISNPQSSALTGLTFKVEGLPEGWTYSVPNDTSIEPGKEAIVPVFITANSGATADSVLVVFKDGKEIGRQALPRVQGPATGGLSGLFTLALSDTAQFIVVILLVAVVVILLVARRVPAHPEHGSGGHGGHGLTPHEHEKLQAVKSEVLGGGHEEGHGGSSH